MKNEKVIGRLLLLEHINKEEAIKMLGGFTEEEYNKVGETIKANIEEIQRRFEDRTEKINQLEEKINALRDKKVVDAVKTYEWFTQPFIMPMGNVYNDYQSSCPCNVKNGGSGICHCTFSGNITYTINDVNKF